MMEVNSLLLSMMAWVIAEIRKTGVARTTIHQGKRTELSGPQGSLRQVCVCVEGGRGEVKSSACMMEISRDVRGLHHVRVNNKMQV